MERQLARRQNDKETYQGILDEYMALENSETVYNVVTNSNKLSSDAGGETRFNKGTKEIDVVAGTKLPLLESLPHELKHAYGYEVGELSFGYNGGGGELYDLDDEIQGYQRSQAFGYYPNQFIDAHWVNTNKGYTTLGTTQLRMSSPLGSGTEGSRMIKQMFKAGRIGIEPKQVYRGWEKDYAAGQYFKILFGQ